MRILVAEDHPDNREMLMRRLARRGHDVHPAENGREAVDRALALAPELILMDISMPILSGMEATRALRATEAGRKIRIIALTAHAMVDARNECLEAGCDAFATKPVDFAALINLIENPAKTV